MVPMAPIDSIEKNGCTRICDQLTLRNMSYAFSAGVTFSGIVFAPLVSKDHLYICIMGIFGGTSLFFQTYFDRRNYPKVNFVFQNRLRALGSDLYFSLVEEFLNVGEKGQKIIYDIAMGYFSSLSISTLENLIHSNENTKSLKINTDPIFFEESSVALMTPQVSEDITSTSNDLSLHRNSYLSLAFFILLGNIGLAITDYFMPLKEGTMEWVAFLSLGLSILLNCWEIFFVCKKKSSQQLTSKRAKNLPLGSLFLLGSGGMVASRYLTPLNQQTVEFLSLTSLSFTAGFTGWEWILQKKKNVFQTYKEKITSAGFVEKPTKTIQEQFFEKIGIVPSLATFALGPLYAVRHWAALPIGVLMGTIYKENRAKLNDLDLFREPPLEGNERFCFNLSKVPLSLAGIVYNTRFYTRILKMGGIDMQNFIPFLPGYLGGYFGGLLACFLFKKYGRTSGITREAFCLFVLNNYLFTSFFLWVLNEPNIGMTNKDVSSTTLAFSQVAWFCMGFALGMEKAIPDSPFLINLLRDTVPHTSYMLFFRWFIEHSLGNE